MADFTNVLIAAASADKAAAQAMDEWQNRNYAEFVNALAVELAKEGNDVRARQLAGLHLKNVLSAKDPQMQEQKHNAWKALSEESRDGVKRQLLQVLASADSTARHTGAQAAAEVAAIELPYNAWREFLPNLLENVTKVEIAEGTKIACLECLGFTCERIAALDGLPPIPETTTDAMLTTIVDGIQNSRPDKIRLAAAAALKNSLFFTEKNMEKKAERDTIMANICEATRASDADVRSMAYQCITMIAYLYYDKLQEYMMTLFELTTKTISNDQEEVAKAAIEFWSTLAEVEMDLMDEIMDFQMRGLPPDRQCLRYASAAVEHLVPLLLEGMTKQDEDGDADGDQYALYVASSTCLTLIAQAVEDQVTPYVLPFVQQHIQSDNWHFREAAIMAFACILEGASSDSIGGAVSQSIPVLLNALSDPIDLVKDSTAYVIAKICELHVRSIPSDMFPTLVNGLMGKLTSESPRISAQAANALNKLGTAFDGDTAAETTGTNMLSSFMPLLLQNLLAAADRQDANEHNLRTCAYEAINVFVQNSAPDVKSLLLHLLPAALERLNASFNLPVLTNDEKEAKEGLQGLICALFQVLVQKLDKDDVTPTADAIMSSLLQVLQSKNASSHAEALSAISAITDIMGAEFEKYMSALQPFLLAGLRQFDAYHVCGVAVGLVGDISRALDDKIEPYTKDIMEALVESLRDTTLHRSVKPPVLSCFGDIALAIEARYEPFVQISLMLLFQASATDPGQDDEEMIEYVNVLREAILEAYTGIIQGLKHGNRTDLFKSYLPAVMDFLKKIAEDTGRDDYVVVKAVGLIGDLAAAFGVEAKQQLNQQFVSHLLQAAIQIREPQALDTANWAGGLVQQLLQ